MNEENEKPEIQVIRSTDNRSGIWELVKCTLTSDELRNMGQQLARENQAVYNLEKEKKLFTADITAKIKAANGVCEATTDTLNNGYEMRDAQVMYLMDDPEPGLKKVVRCDDYSLVRSEPMTPAEITKQMQGRLFGDQQ